MAHHHHDDDLPISAPQGAAPGGTIAYSNNDRYPFSGIRNHDGNFFTGYQWQCVEFARRWLWDRKALMLPDVEIAAQIFFAPHMYDPIAHREVPTRCIRNGGTEKPTADTFLIYKADVGNFPGHIAVITEVGDDYIRIADQNREFRKWPGDYALQLELKHEDGLWTIIDKEDPVLGWVEFTGVPNVPLPDVSDVPATWTTEAGVMHAKMRRPLPADFDRIPDYTPRTKRWMMMMAMRNYHPHPIVFPFMIAKVLFLMAFYGSYHLAKTAISKVVAVAGRRGSTTPATAAAATTAAPQQ